VESDSGNSRIVFEVVNGIAGIRWNWFRERNWFRNVQHCGIGSILIGTHPIRLESNRILSDPVRSYRIIVGFRVEESMSDPQCWIPMNSNEKPLDVIGSS
jgi:hypothetical protein